MVGKFNEQGNMVIPLDEETFCLSFFMVDKNDPTITIFDLMVYRHVESGFWDWVEEKRGLRTQTARWETWFIGTEELPTTKQFHTGVF